MKVLIFDKLTGARKAADLISANQVALAQTLGYDVDASGVVVGQAPDEDGNKHSMPGKHGLEAWSKVITMVDANGVPTGKFCLVDPIIRYTKQAYVIMMTNVTNATQGEYDEPVEDFSSV